MALSIEANTALAHELMNDMKTLGNWDFDKSILSSSPEYTSDFRRIAGYSPSSLTSVLAG